MFDFTTLVLKIGSMIALLGIVRHTRIASISLHTLTGHYIPQYT